MAIYIYQQPAWPEFEWSYDHLLQPLAKMRHRQGLLSGKMEGIGFDLQAEAMVQTLTFDAVKSSEIEGEMLDYTLVRSSVATRLGLDIGISTDRHVEGVVEMQLDATRNCHQDLTAERLFGWHAALFPTGRSGMREIVVGHWRDGTRGPMQVVSGRIGKETVHFEAPPAAAVPGEIEVFLDWVNGDAPIDPILKAAIAHFWFVTIHPFADGNGRIARAIADMLLSRSEKGHQRYYSMSAQIRIERQKYYSVLEASQKRDLDITEWLVWFVACLDRAIAESEEMVTTVLSKHQFWYNHKDLVFNIRQVAMIDRLLTGFEGKLTSSKWAKINKCSQDTALRDIQDLVKKQVLIKEAAGGRSTSYLMKTW